MAKKAKPKRIARKMPSRTALLERRIDTLVHMVRALDSRIAESEARLERVVGAVRQLRAQDVVDAGEE